MNREVPSSWAVCSLQQVDHAVGQALFAQHDVQLAAGGDLLQDFQLAQPHERRVVLASSLAVLAWLRMAAVSSRRTIRLASAAFLASVTLFIRSFISPGRMMSRMPTEIDLQTQLTGAADERSLPARSATASLSVRNASSSRVPTTARRASCASRYSACRASSDHADGLPGVDDAVGHHGVQAQRDLVGRHDVLAGDVEHRLAQVDLDDLDLGHVLPEGVPPGGSVSTYSPSWNSTPTWCGSTVPDVEHALGHAPNGRSTGRSWCSKRTLRASTTSTCTSRSAVQ